MRSFILSIFVVCSACGSGEFSSSMQENSDNDSGFDAATNNADPDSGSTTNNINNVVMDMGTTDTEGAEDMDGMVDATADVAIDTGPEWHPMFVAAADFFLEKCVNCHAVGQNGNFAMPQNADASYEEVMLAIDGVVSTDGLLIIEPNDPAASQAFLMMTNAAGEQFDAATIAIVEDWINAGAPYLAN